MDTRQELPPDGEIHVLEGLKILLNRVGDREFDKAATETLISVAKGIYWSKDLHDKAKALGAEVEAELDRVMLYSRKEQ